MDLKLVKPSKALKEYLEASDLTLPNLADAYLHISRSITGLLLKYAAKWRKLKKGYIDILELIDNIQQKKNIPSGGGVEIYSLQKTTVWNNYERVQKNIELYVMIMLNLRETKIHFIISMSALAVSGFSLFLFFFF